MSLNCCAMTGVKSQDRVVRRKVRRIFKAKQIEKNKKKILRFCMGPKLVKLPTEYYWVTQQVLARLRAKPASFSAIFTQLQHSKAHFT